MRVNRASGGKLCIWVVQILVQRGSGKRTGGTTHAALWASPEAKAGMLRLHFEQVKGKAVAGAIMMGSYRTLLDGVSVLCAKEIALRTAVMDDTIGLTTRKGQPVAT